MSSSNGNHATANADAKKLVGFSNFKRQNPRSDLFESKDFHHLEFWCSDATNVSSRFQWGLGFNRVAKSDMSTGNHVYSSHVLRSGKCTFAFTAPYGVHSEALEQPPHPAFNRQTAHDFVAKHGLAVRAVGITVADARQAFEAATKNGAIAVLEPTGLVDAKTQKTLTIAEISLYGDVVLRFLSGEFDGPLLPNYETQTGPDLGIGIYRVDHCVGNVPNLIEQIQYMMKATGWHEFAEFTADDVGTVDSGLNSMVLANNEETILLPVNEPTHGTRRKSQIQTYLEQNNGSGLQHIALKTDDIFATVREMRKRAYVGGFDFMPAPPPTYYKALPDRIGDTLTQEQYKEVEELGLLVDQDDQGTLVQVFTKPLGDRSTAFIEIIQRVGCMYQKGSAMEQKPACGGFGKGNFAALFKSIEDYERSLNIN